MENHTTDHDLLITLHEQVRNIGTDIKEIKDGTAITLSDHEKRLRTIERWGAILIGISYAIQFYFNFLNK
jgi:hypothetical protein